MGISESNNGITPFGVEASAEPTAAPSSIDTFSSYLNEGLLFLIAALVVAVFLIYHFARWYLNQPTGVQVPVEVGPAPAQPIQTMDEEPAEEVVLRPRRPWNAAD